MPSKLLHNDSEGTLGGNPMAAPDWTQLLKCSDILQTSKHLSQGNWNPQRSRNNETSPTVPSYKTPASPLVRACDPQPTYHKHLPLPRPPLTLIILLHCPPSGLNIFFNSCSPAPTAAPLALLLTAYPFGKFLAFSLPIRTYRIPMPNLPASFVPAPTATTSRPALIFPNLLKAILRIAGCIQTNPNPTGQTVGGQLFVDNSHSYADLDELIVNHVQAMARVKWKS